MARVEPFTFSTDLDSSLTCTCASWSCCFWLSWIKSLFLHKDLSVKNPLGRNKNQSGLTESFIIFSCSHYVTSSHVFILELTSIFSSKSSACRLRNENWKIIHDLTFQGRFLGNFGGCIKKSKSWLQRLMMPDIISLEALLLTRHTLSHISRDVFIVPMRDFVKGLLQKNS